MENTVNYAALQLDPKFGLLFDAIDDLKNKAKERNSIEFEKSAVKLEQLTVDIGRHKDNKSSLESTFNKISKELEKFSGQKELKEHKSKVGYFFKLLKSAFTFMSNKEATGSYVPTNRQLLHAEIKGKFNKLRQSYLENHQETENPAGDERSRIKTK